MAFPQNSFLSFAQSILIEKHTAFSKKHACFPIGKVAFPIHLTCQNRQDLNNWLVKDLCSKHEGESKNGAEKILQRELKRFGMNCSNANGRRISVIGYIQGRRQWGSG